MVSGTARSGGDAACVCEDGDLPAGAVANDADCDDDDSGVGACEPYCEDADRDGYVGDEDGDRRCDTALCLCPSEVAALDALAPDSPGALPVTDITGWDCDDHDTSISPALEEVCEDGDTDGDGDEDEDDQIDNDCDGDVLGIGASNGEPYYVDTDGDGYGNED